MKWCRDGAAGAERRHGCPGTCILTDISTLIFHPFSSFLCACSVGIAMALPGESIFIAPIAAVILLVQIAV